MVVITICVSVVGIKSYPKYNNKASELLEYWLMGRRLTLPVFVATLTSTWYGGIFSVTQIAFEHGIYSFISQGVVWYIVYISFALFAVKRLERGNLISIPDLICRKYGHTSGNISAIILFIKSLPITYAISMGAFLHAMFNIDISFGIFLSCLFVTISCMLGGFRGLVFRDIVQFCVMYAGALSVVLFAIYKFGVSEYLSSKLSSNYFSLSGNHQLSAIILWFIVAFSSVFVSPIFYQRCMAASSKKVAKYGVLISTFLWLIFDLCTVLGGMYAKATMPDTNSLYAYLFFGISILPCGFKGLFLAGIIATTLSTLDAFLFVSSSIIAYDLSPKHLRGSKILRIFSTIACGFCVFIISIFAGENMEAVIIAFEICSCAPLIIPILFSYLFKRNFILNDAQCTSSILLCVISICVLRLLKYEMDYIFLGTVNKGFAK
ncbi:Sodium:solute symporter family protein [Candidatus Cyrtobacter comes]|uniref:Sodium:solute symporter family protein n=1 Tax=Candidatus Cyrtobacter comes TaxID=675776 RepID=A0ABU5L6L0_9RICK|nr:Sodium:solute symporter family protein [Candidatus Cyrtobacter comes]